MLLSRIVILKNIYFELLRNHGKEIQNPNEKYIYLINVFDQILFNFEKIHTAFQRAEFQEDFIQLEKEIHSY